MIAKWIAQAMMRGQDRLTLNKHELAQWYAQGASLWMGTPYSTVAGPYCVMHIGRSFQQLVNSMVNTDPSGWRDCRPGKVQSVGEVRCRLPELECSQKGEDLWEVPLVPSDISHALGGWSYDVTLSVEELAAIKPLARELATRMLLRHEIKASHLQGAWPCWNSGRITLALLGGFSPNEIRQWFRMTLPQQGLPPTVCVASTEKYQDERREVLRKIQIANQGEKVKESRTVPAPKSAQLFKAGDYEQEACLSESCGTYNLTFRSRMASARNAQEWRKNFDLILDAESLARLQKLIAEGLKSS